LPIAIMYLPTEALYAEALRRAALVSELQQNCRVSVVGPSSFMHMMSTFQMAFRTMDIQKKGSEVWKILGTAKTEFERFGGLMDKVEKQVGTVQNTLRELGGKTRTINRALKNVSSLDTLTAAPAPASNLIGFEEGNGIAPLLAASEDGSEEE